MRARLVLGLVFSLVVGRASAERIRVEGIAAIVGGSSPHEGTVVLLHGDVELEAYLGRARASTALTTALTSSERDAARERLVGRALLVHEAARLRLDAVDVDRTTTEWHRFFERHGGAEVVESIAARLGLAEDELERYVVADAIARNFVLASSEQGGIVTDVEIEMAWEAADHPFVGMDLETMREPMRALLLERRVEAESTRWIDRLRARVVVRRNRL